MENERHIVVAGAGAVGCFVGGLLAASGQRVTLLVRQKVHREIRSHGLTLTDFAGLARNLSVEDIDVSEDPACLGLADLILVTVKSGDTKTIGQAIAEHARPGATIITLQNGTENVATLRALLPDHDLRAGIVPFNVVPMGQGGFHRAMSGDIVIEAGSGEVAEQLSIPQLSVTESAQITDLQWGTFLINLNNSLNALSGLTLHKQLQDRQWRRLMADQWAEALKVLRAHGIAPKLTASVPVALAPFILRLPGPLFRWVAGQFLSMDAQARASMAHDLLRGQATEVDVLQGQVVRMGQEVGKPTPISARVAEIVALAEQAAEGLPDLPIEALRP